MLGIFRRAEDRHTDRRMAMINNSAGMFGGQATNQSAQTSILRQEPKDGAVHVEYIPVENGYVVNISSGYGSSIKIYVAKDLVEAHELVTTYMVKERLK